MNENSGACTHPDQIELEAIAWFTRMQGNPSHTDQVDFRIWLDADIVHRQTYNEISKLWSSAKNPELKITESDAYFLEGRLGVVRRRRKLAKSVSIITGCLALLLAGSWFWLEKPHFIQDFQADYVTTRAEHRLLTLTDGSTVLMDADTALDVEIGMNERRVKILRGMAFFTVRPSDVPFVVAASNGEAKVLGTSFDVSVVDQNVRVTLEHGSVQVTAGQDHAAVILKPGEEVFYNAQGIGTIQKADLDEAMAWHEKRYIFTNARFADVIDYIGRYRKGRIIVIGETLSNQRISGSFSLEDTDAALASVQSITGFKSTSLSDKLLIIRP